MKIKAVENYSPWSGEWYAIKYKRFLFWHTMKIKFKDYTMLKQAIQRIHEEGYDAIKKLDDFCITDFNMDALDISEDSSHYFIAKAYLKKHFK